jgi:hypothetical protein
MHDPCAEAQAVLDVRRRNPSVPFSCREALQRFEALFPRVGAGIPRPSGKRFEGRDLFIAQAAALSPLSPDPRIEIEASIDVTGRRVSRTVMVGVGTEEIEAVTPRLLPARSS